MKKWIFALATLSAGVFLWLWFIPSDPGPRLRRLEYQRLELMERSLYALDLFQQCYPNLQTDADLHIFFSKKLLNDILGGVEGYLFGIPGGKGTVLVEGIEVAFESGVPFVEINAVAMPGKVTDAATIGDRYLRLRVSAYLLLDMDSAREVAVLRIQWLDVVPELVLADKPVKFQGLANRILALEAHDWADLGMTFDLPLRQDFQFEQERRERSQRFEVCGGAIQGTFSTPHLLTVGSLELQQTLFRDDGAHLFLSLEFRDVEVAP